MPCDTPQAAPPTKSATGYPVAVIEIDDLSLVEGAGWIGGIRGHFEITGRDERDWFCFDVEATDSRGHWFRLPEDSPFRKFILDEVNGAQRSVVVDAVSEEQREHYPEDDNEDPCQRQGWSNPLSPVVL